MKRILFNITRASLATFAAYLLLSFAWRAILSGVKSESLYLFLVATMSSLAFAFFLLYFTKIRKSAGEDEVVDDYEVDPAYTLKNDIRHILRREGNMLIYIAAIVLLCFLLNTFDRVVFHHKVISFPTFLFVPMCLYSTCFKISVIGYIVSALVNCAGYVLFLLHYRKKKYDYWIKKEQ